MQANSIIIENWNKILNALKANKNYGQKWENLMNDLPDIDYEESKKLKDYKHAAHVFLWSKNDQKLWNIDTVASIMMQMRFDGYIGFPGGLIDPSDKSIVDGLNRELKEEMNLEEKYFVTDENYFFTSVNRSRKLLLHFYIKQVTQQDFNLIEKEAMNSHDYGGEVMGLIRPPLFDIRPNRGFNIFLQNQFVGNSLFQLLKSINYCNILDNQQLLNFINSC